MDLTWMYCQGAVWCGLHTLDFNSMHGQTGVYIIFYAGNPGRVVYVGSGNIAERLAAHRTSPDIQAYVARDLKVTWAAVEPHWMQNVERYLADNFHPLVGDAHPDVVPVAVNSPF